MMHPHRINPKGTGRRLGLIVIATALALLARVCPGQCHGVEGDIQAARGYRITAAYDDGEPMSYAAVKIEAPDSDTAFQAGRTDRNGVMMFLPDRPGRWQAIITDGMGHRLALVLEVVAAHSPAEAEGPAPAPSKHHAGKTQNIITGLAIIFGLCGVLYGWTARFRRASRRLPRDAGP